MPSVTIAELQSRVPVQSQLIDVRSLSEFAAGHIPGAINIPMDQIESRLDDLCSTVPIILVCQMGTRARMTAALLESCRSDLAILRNCRLGSSGTSIGIEHQGAVVPGAASTTWGWPARTEWGNTGAHSEPSLALPFRIHRPGPDFRGHYRPLSDGGDSGQVTLERAEPLQTAGSRPGSLEHRTVILSTAQSTLQCKNFEMSVEHQTAAPVFDSLTRQHKDSVYRQMLRVCGNRQDAEDVLIEALLKAYRHLDQLRDSSAFRAWLAQIARRVCWQLKEQEALLPLLQLSMLEAEGREIPGSELTPEAQFARGQMKQLLDDAVAVLPSLYQSVYKLRDIENRPGDQVAKKLGISGAAMKSRLHRARELIGLHLDAALLRESSRWVFHLGGLYGNYSRTSGGGTV